MTDAPLYYVNAGTIRVSRQDVFLALACDTGDGPQPVCTLALPLQFAATMAERLRGALDDYILATAQALDEPDDLALALPVPVRKRTERQTLGDNADAIAAMVREGATQRQIAHTYSVGRGAVCRFLHARGIRPDALSTDTDAQVRILIAQGAREREIMRECGLTQRRLRQWLAEHEEDVCVSA